MSYLIFMILMRQCLAVSNLSSSEPRIVKGYKVIIQLHPYSVFLHFKKYIPTVCGATLITDQCVITSASCLYEMGQQDGKITAYLGATIPLNAKIKRHVEMFSVHKRFNRENGKFNLAIAYLNMAVPLTSDIQKIPICTKLPKINEALYTTGWGKEIPGKVPDYTDHRHLKASKQKLISPRECEQITRARMTPALWCTLSINGYHYHGDNGNGLVNSEKHLVGVVSYMVNEITVYSDVMRELVWINTTVVNLFKNFCKRKIKLKH